MGKHELKRTPLHALHEKLGARMVEFAGYDMPVQYSGVIAEHEAVRTAAGLFDVSHMGELHFRGAGAVATVEKLLPGNVSALPVGRAVYSVLLKPDGGIVDDVIVYRLGLEELLMVVNAANRDKDAKWCASHLGEGCVFRDVSDAWALLALQGPKAAEILAPLTSVDLDATGPFHFAWGEVAGARAIASRTGYTGEDGFEIFVAPAAAPVVWEALLAAGRDKGLLPAGLGARDTLRTEVKYSLYGNDIDETTTPLEAGLEWLVKWDKGEFIGREALERQKAAGLRRKLVGFEMVDPGIPRHGFPIVEGEREIGKVTSGTFSPTLRRAIGLGYVPVEKSGPGSEISVSIRGSVRRARVVQTPFYRRGGVAKGVDTG
jgi:aminomethyltransferase